MAASVGASVGVRGARVGVSAKGRAYGHVGAGGVGYRFSSGGGKGRGRAAGPASIEQWQGVGSADPSPTWFVSCRGETIGPMSDATIREWAALGAINPGTYLQSSAGGPWVPFEQMGFSPSTSHTVLGIILGAVGVAGFVVAVLVLFSSCGQGRGGVASTRAGWPAVASRG